MRHVHRCAAQEPAGHARKEFAETASDHYITRLRTRPASIVAVDMRNASRARALERSLQAGNVRTNLLKAESNVACHIGLSSRDRQAGQLSVCHKEVAGQDSATHCGTKRALRCQARSIAVIAALTYINGDSSIVAKSIDRLSRARDAVPARGSTRHGNTPTRLDAHRTCTSGPQMPDIARFEA